jgi:hypothetical protein
MEIAEHSSSSASHQLRHSTSSPNRQWDSGSTPSLSRTRWSKMWATLARQIWCKFTIKLKTRKVASLTSRKRLTSYSSRLATWSTRKIHCYSSLNSSASKRRQLRLVAFTRLIRCCRFNKTLTNQTSSSSHSRKKMPSLRSSVLSNTVILIIRTNKFYSIKPIKKNWR